jgi:excisionase family DNA binding protein
VTAAAPYREPDMRMLLSIPEVAVELGCGRDTVYSLLSSGLLTSVRVGARLRRIRRQDLQTYVASLEPSIPSIR